MNYKRRHRKTKVRCTICTPHRNGNAYLRLVEVKARADERQQRREVGV